MIFFLLWTSTPEELELFKAHLNDIHSTIKFTFETSPQKISYLDVQVYLEGNHLQVSPHFKNTNTFSYVMGNSFHPESTFKGIVQGENTRILRNCSKEQTYKDTMTFLIQR